MPIQVVMDGKLQTALLRCDLQEIAHRLEDMHRYLDGPDQALMREWTVQMIDLVSSVQLMYNEVVSEPLRLSQEAS